MKNTTILLKDIGRTEYQTAFDLQTKLFEELKQIKIKNKYSETPTVTNNYFIFTEHTHVYTLGKSGKKEHLLLSDAEMAQKNVQFIPTNRGGDITYHGPGQIVGYPIIDLDNFDIEILAYMRKLEEVIIKVLSHYHIHGERSEGETGVWLDVGKPNARKICALGVKTSRWVTMHGFALNVHVDLDYFKHIIPCGIKNKGVTSIEKELHEKVNIEEIKKLILHYFALEFKANIIKNATRE